MQPSQDPAERAAAKLTEKLFTRCGLAVAAARALSDEERAALVDLCYDAAGELEPDYQTRLRDWWVARQRASVEAETKKLVATTRNRLAERGRQRRLGAASERGEAIPSAKPPAPTPEP